jgi:nucleoside-diphosphate-sugar epimerase
MLQHSQPNSVKPQRLVVLGGTGFVGGYLGRLAAEAGWDLASLGSHDVDLLSANAASELEGLLQSNDTVVYASSIAPAKTASDILKNAVMTEAFCRGLERAQVAHLIVISSDAVYSDSASRVNEDSPAAPDTAHGVMHLMRERMCREASFGRLAVVRPTAIYGFGDPHNSYGPNRFVRNAQQSGRIDIFGNGEAIRDHIAVEDVAEIIFRVAARASVGTVNAVSGDSISFRNLAELVAAGFRNGVTVESVGLEASPTFRSYDTTVLSRSFPDWRPRRIGAGVAELVESTSSHQ